MEDNELFHRFAATRGRGGHLANMGEPDGAEIRAYRRQLLAIVGTAWPSRRQRKPRQKTTADLANVRG